MTPAEATSRLIAALRRTPAPEIRPYLDAGAEVGWDILVKVTTYSPERPRVEVAILLDSYLPGCWETVGGHWITPRAVAYLPMAHMLAGGMPAGEWVPALAGAGLIDINRRSMHGTRPLHHAALGANSHLVEVFRAAGAVDCPVEVPTRSEAALLRMRGGWDSQRWAGRTAAEILEARKGGAPI